MKGGKYTKTLAKIQIGGIFRIRDIRRNVLPKFMGPIFSFLFFPGLDHKWSRDTDI